MSYPFTQLGEHLQLDLDVLPVDASATYKMAGVLSFGKGLFLREAVQGGSTSYRKFYKLKADHVVMSLLFGWEGALALSSPAFEGRYLSPQFPTFSCRPTLDRQYLGHCLQLPGTWEQLARQAKGMGDRRKTLSPQHLLNVMIPLPPLAEQRRIAGRVEAVAALIADARRLRDAAISEGDSLRSSFLEALLPRHAKQIPLRETAESGTSISYGVLVPGPDVADGIPFVRIQDLAVKSPPPVPAKRIAPEIDAQYERTRLEGGEVLIAVVGATIGKVGIAPVSWKGANIARAVCRIRPADNVDRRYLAAVLQSPSSQQFFAKQTRTQAQPTLNVGQLEQTLVPLPTLPEQRRIVAHLDALQAKADSLRALQSKTAEELDALLPSVLNQAFAGGL